ncbi:MAG TPA: hypothetical protein VGK67_14200 [Myxococcales bacterium]|jgi:hypothetical protein
MKKFLLGLLGVWALAFGAWLLVFRSLDPCEAMRQEVESLAKQSGDADGKVIRDALLGPKAPPQSAAYCAQVAVSIKLKGRGAVVIVGK